MKLLRRTTNWNKGFTLVELLVVVTIVAILAGIMVPNFMGAVTRAKVARAFAEMRGIGNAVQMHWIDHDTFPVSSADLTKPGLVYMTSIPVEPFNGDGTRSVEAGALAEKSYGYYTTADAAWIIVSNGPNRRPNVAEGGIDWSLRTVGQLGGWEGAQTGYGYSWYDPQTGMTSTGDLGISGP